MARRPVAERRQGQVEPLPVVAVVQIADDLRRNVGRHLVGRIGSAGGSAGSKSLRHRLVSGCAVGHARRHQRLEPVARPGCPLLRGRLEPQPAGAERPGAQRSRDVAGLLQPGEAVVVVRVQNRAPPRTPPARLLRQRDRRQPPRTPSRRPRTSACAVAAAARRSRARGDGRSSRDAGRTRRQTRPASASGRHDGAAGTRAGSTTSPPTGAGTSRLRTSGCRSRGARPSRPEGPSGPPRASPPSRGRTSVRRSRDRRGAARCPTRPARPRRGRGAPVASNR